MSANRQFLGQLPFRRIDFANPQDKIRHDRLVALVEQMLEDEAKHSRTAKAAGGLEFPKPVKQGMSLLSRLMTESSYRI